MDQSFFERTVEQTSAAYQRLEGNPVLNALFQGKCSLEDYRDILVLLYQFYSGFEYKLVQSGTGKLAGTLFYTHLKTPLLEGDLEVLDYHLSDCPIPSQIGLQSRSLEPAEALGTWYILEKATFIWSRMSKLMKRRYGLDSATGLAFFTNYGNRFEFFWDEFLLFLSSQVRYPSDELDFITAANATLESLDQWLQAGYHDQRQAPAPALPDTTPPPVSTETPSRPGTQKAANHGIARRPSRRDSPSRA